MNKYNFLILVFNYFKLFFVKFKNFFKAQIEQGRKINKKDSKEIFAYEQKERKTEKGKKHEVIIFNNEDGSPLKFNRPQKRNTLCICGSGLKYKICCLQKDLKKMYQL